ncbi:outer membrane protein OmpA [Actimicrobium sp. CCI2.3]|uniref:outer membrane protein OmpA n=1 Tax=Actimicrobium sp. CCI2.3 TaxID=3048616 RepID=UPI002AB428E3|nr:OmpA family protein [Actimicrobium sp. CCI2.3]MDY7575951.1 OmpA family protein [Actimicrobium sp. CCI2.3]MEB0023217.1 OmpA family protein [Actimicrobium sp. CCI2.3]
MNKLVKLVFAASAVVALSAQAQENIQAKTPTSAYVQDARGVIVRDPFGLCWRTGYWTPADAVPGCDGEIAKPAMTPVAAPAPAPAPAPVVVVPAPVSEKVTFAADAFFDFDKSVLKPDGKAKLDDLASKLQGMNLEVIIAVGHTDSVGTDAYNQKLSVRRSEAVKAYLVSKGIEANRVYTEGKGEKQPVADNKSAAGRAKNRRVEIEVVGTRTK